RLVVFALLRRRRDPVALRLALLALLLDQALGAEQLHDRHLGAVPLALSELEGAGVAAGPAREPRAERGEEFLHHVTVGHLRRHQPPRVQIVTARQRDELLRERTQLLRLRQRGANALVTEERRRQTPQQGPA